MFVELSPLQGWLGYVFRVIFTNMFLETRILYRSEKANVWKLLSKIAEEREAIKKISVQHFASNSLKIQLFDLWWYILQKDTLS